MEKKEIEISLHFSGDKTGLAGNDNGREAFITQIKSCLGKLDEIQNTKIVLIFPNQIKRIAISFTQGITAELADAVGRSALPSILDIRTSRPELTEKVYRDMVVAL